jgi:hypothetical protein
VLVNSAHDVGGDAEGAHEGEPLDNAIDVRRRRRFRNVAQPRERGGVELDVVDEKPVEATELLGRQRRDKGSGRAPSSLGTPGQTEPFDCIRGGQDELGGA